MININQITTQLRMLPDQALQRMAMMYKQDPYIFPMVISEDIARKKMRAAAQAQMAQPQPKVADQAIMAMGQQPQPAPGIAGLQAPNMERMADGGIAGYADGGDMDFADRSEPVVRMAEGGAVQRYQDRGLVSTTGTLAQVQAPVMENLQALQAQLVEAERVLAAAARSGDAQSVTQYAQAVQKLRDQINQTAEKSFGNRAQQVVSELQAKPTAPSDEAIRAAYGPSANRMPQVQTPAAAGSASGTGARPPAAGAAPAAARAPSEGGIYALTGRMFDPVAQELKGLRGRMMMDAERRSDEELMQYEAGKPKGKIAEELEKTLRKEEEGATGERKQAAATAIFNAGLAMMAGTSPRALENIAKGAMAGSAQYGEALKDLKKASKERQKMLADIEQARRAEARDDHKTAMEYLRRRNEREERADGFFLEASAKLGFSKADAATRLYGTQMETESRERTASRSDPLALFKALGDGDVKKGYQAAQEMKGEPGMIRQLAMEAVKNPAQLKVLESTNPQLYNQIMAEINKLGGGAAGAGLDLSQWGSPQQVGGR
jgi:hypothetical protein